MDVRDANIVVHSRMAAEYNEREPHFRPENQARVRARLERLRAEFGGRLLDIGCGTGRFLDFVKQAWPRLAACGLDMSEAYVRHAQRRLAGRSRMKFVVGKAEAIPAPDNSQDAVTSIFVFHELPPQVRRAALAECARVLRPGGRLVLLDSLQRGDRPDYEGLLELFPQNYHEPFYLSYIEEDFAALARDCGLTRVRDVPAFVSKVMVFDKPSASQVEIIGARAVHSDAGDASKSRRRAGRRGARLKAP